MKKLLTVFFVLVLSALSASELKVGVIDLCFALSMHPRMALFDFERLGFAKIDLGLSKEAYAKKLAELKEQNGTKGQEAQIAELEKIIEKNSIKSSDIISRLYRTSMSRKEAAKLKSEADLLQKENEKLRAEIDELKYQMQNPDLTSLVKTEEILKTIETEISEAIQQAAERLKLDLVLNTSTPFVTGFSPSYRVGISTSHGVGGVENALFYSFMGRLGTDKEPAAPSKRDALAWLSLTHHPLSLRVLPMQPWPLVLKGGQNILPDVIKIVYKRYNASNAVINTVCELAEERYKQNLFCPRQK